MVVVLASAATVFWMEYRRFVRSRRYWALLLGTLIVTLLGCLILWAIAVLLPAVVSTGTLPFAVAPMSALASMPNYIQGVANTRLMYDTYKTRTLPDLFLTPLHPLGVVLGKMAASTALATLSLLTLTPAALWICALQGIPYRVWGVAALLSLGSYLMSAANDAYLRREIQARMPDIETAHSSAATYSWFLASLPLTGWLTVGIISAFFPSAVSLMHLPFWAIAPFTVPMLALYGNPTHVVVGLLSTLGLSLWLGLATAQWRDWWSPRTYLLLRWGGTAFWIWLICANAWYLAQVFGSNPLSAERLLFVLLITVAVLNLVVAPLMGYYGFARRPVAARGALRYPWGGILWQWSLQWLTAIALYLTVGLATGHWVAPERGLLWAVYAWLAFVALPQAWAGESWAVAARMPTPLQGDHWHGLLYNTRTARIAWEKNANLASIGARFGLWWLAVAVCLSWAARAAHHFAPLLPLQTIADWLPRLHPWWGFYREWQGIGNNWLYVVYTGVLAIALWAWKWRSGVQQAKHTEQFLQNWRQQREAEAQP
ncbi:MAG: hypothetical protein NZM10_01850 [Fimbriimonadales bacterium]|nr:hypothetical protein [Fimbriimonadales bacterium]